MKTLTVLMDDRCTLCEYVSGWLLRQSSYVRLELVGLRSAERLERYPEFEEAQLTKELHVISDDGQLWKGGPAWVMVLWALREYRGWAQRLASPTLLPYTETIVKRISRARHSKRLDRVLQDVWWQRALDQRSVSGQPR